MANIEDRKASAPVRAFSRFPSSFNFSLSGTILTATFTTPPPANQTTGVDVVLVN